MKLLVILFVELPCMLIIALPVALVSYLVCWVVGGWRLGQYMFDLDDSPRAWKYKVPSDGGGR